MAASITTTPPSPLRLNDITIFFTCTTRSCLISSFSGKYDVQLSVLTERGHDYHCAEANSFLELNAYEVAASIDIVLYFLNPWLNHIIVD